MVASPKPKPGDTLLSSSFPFNQNDHASSDILHHRNISATLLSNDLMIIEKWGKGNIVSFNQSQTKQTVISHKQGQKFPSVLMNGDELDTSSSFTELGLSLSYNRTWSTHIHSLAKHASQKLGFLARARGFSSSHLLTTYKSQIRPSLDYCSHVWGGTPKSTLCLLDKVQSKAIRLINNPNLTKSLQPLCHRRLVEDLSIFLQILSRALFSGVQGDFSSSSEACQSHQKLNSFTPFQSFTDYFKNSLTNRHSSLEHAIDGTSCLLPAFLSPTTCHLSNIRSINLI